MRHTFVSTSNSVRFLSGLDALERRGASEACIMVVDGEPGLGKTTTIQWWATQQQTAFVRAKAEWTPRWLLRELLTGLGKQPENSFERCYGQAIRALSDQSAAAAQEGRTYGIVIDEVDHISRSQKIMDTIRDMSDMLEIPVILVGMGKVRTHITRFPQLASRVGQYVEFAPATLDDTKALVTGLCEVEVKDDLIALLHELALGHCREIKEGIAAIERFAKRNKGPIGIAEMAGQDILNNRATGRPIKVRETAPCA